MSETPEVWDSGLQLERTTLAWLRTALALLAGAVIVARLVAHKSLLVAVLSTVLTIPVAMFVSWLAWRRHLRSHQSLHTRAALPDGRLHAVLAALACALCLAGFGYVLLL